jgi:hypothetical protein
VIVKIVSFGGSVVVTAKVVVAVERVTVDGTEATEGDELERETVTGPAGGAPLRTIVPVADVPPTTLEGVTVTDETCRLLIVTDVVTPSTVMSIRVAQTGVSCGSVPTEKETLSLPAGTVTDPDCPCVGFGKWRVNTASPM